MKKLIFNYALKPQEYLEVLLNENDINIYIALKIIIKKKWRNIYNFIQRKFSSPKKRSYLIKFEKFFLPKNNTILNEFEKVKFSKFKKDEIIFFENLNKSVNFQHILNEINKEQQLYSAYQENMFYLKKERKKDTLMGYIKTENLFKIEEILKLVNHEDIVKMAEHKLGTKAIFDNIWCWWSFKNQSVPLGSQNFHRDYNSINFVKLFVYLSNVDSESGPHIFVRGSATKNVFRKIERYNESDVISEFNNNILNIEGKKFTTFMANTFCLHRGLPPKTNDRLLLCILYSSNPSRAAPKHPPFYFKDYSINDLLIKNKYLNQLYFQ
jgi:hypothetical protein